MPQNSAIKNAVYWPRRLADDEMAITKSWNRMCHKQPVVGTKIQFRCIYPDTKFDTCFGTYLGDFQVKLPGCDIPGCNLHLDPEYTWWNLRIATRAPDILQIDEANWWSES